MSKLKKIIEESYPIEGTDLIRIITTDLFWCEDVKTSEVLDFIETEGLNLATEQGELIGYYQDTTGPEYAPEVVEIDSTKFLDDNWDMVIEKFVNRKEVTCEN